jgi:FtsP/CotA-like multicopper oxidase with cupredoxin domain
MNRTLRGLAGMLCGALSCAAPGSGPKDLEAGGEEGADGADGGVAPEEPAIFDYADPPEAPDLDPAAGRARFVLRAAPESWMIVGPDGSEWMVEGMGYEGSLPGPTLRVSVGDEVEIELENGLETPTTIHWHGVEGVPVAMDGVPSGEDGHGGLRMVAPGERFTYQFRAERAQTAWYHPHFDSSRQVDAGLYGMFVVEDPAEPTVDREMMVVFDDWADPNMVFGDVDSGSTSDEMGMDHGFSVEEGHWTVNGRPSPVLEVPAGSRLRLRLLNASNAGTLVLGRADERPLRVIARDQGVYGLGTVVETQTELMAPGDRVELIVTVGESPIVLVDHPHDHRGGTAWGTPAERLRIQPVGTAAEPSEPDFGHISREGSSDPGSTDVRWTFQGSLVGEDWRINGEVFPDVTVPTCALGDTLTVEVRNISPTEHPFHLHGLPFELLSVDGVAPETYSLEDTLNLGLYSVARLRVEASRAGFWMAHCHILPHADGGMMTFLSVEER